MADHRQYKVERIKLAVPEDKSKLVLAVPGVLSPDECKALITKSEQLGFTEATVNLGSGVRMVVKALRNHEWCIFEDAELGDLLWERLVDVIRAQKIISTTGVSVRVGSGVRVLRYEVGQKFDVHPDTPNDGGNGEWSRMSLIVYLNEGYKGGLTCFCDMDMHDPVNVPQREGQVLLFEHEIYHFASKVVEGTKYLLRANVFYKES